MDGFEANEGIILIAATNRPDVLDPALLRPGRFDRQIVVPNPDVVGREKILKVHVRKVPLAPGVNLKTIARGTPGFSGADLMNLVNESALLAARRGKRLVTMHEFEDAKDKVMMGAERRTLVMTEDEKRLTAYHEGGHAVVAMHVPSTDPVHKATIIPRGRALGMVMQLPERDQLSMSLEQMTSRLAILMGGRVAEEMTFGARKVTSGAASDIEQATKLAARHGNSLGLLRRGRPGRTRGKPGGGVPRPFGGAHPEHLGGDGAQDRPRGAPPCRRRLRRGPANPDRARRRTRNACPGAA
jgi:cell division protease FtsH